jgi:hypothetical protein
MVAVTALKHEPVDSAKLPGRTEPVSVQHRALPERSGGFDVGKRHKLGDFNGLLQRHHSYAQATFH